MKNKNFYIFSALVCLLLISQSQSQSVAITDEGLQDTCKFSDKPCNNNGRCTDQGLCLCNTHYYGQNCENIVKENKRVEIIHGEITGGGIAGIVIGFLILIPLIFFIGCWATRKFDDNHNGLFGFYTNRQPANENDEQNKSSVGSPQDIPQEPVRVNQVQHDTIQLESERKQFIAQPMFRKKTEILKKQITLYPFFQNVQDYKAKAQLFVTINDKIEQTDKYFEQNLKFENQEEEAIEMVVVNMPEHKNINNLGNKNFSDDINIDEHQRQSVTVADENYHFKSHLKARKTIQELPELQKGENVFSKESKEDLESQNSRRQKSKNNTISLRNSGSSSDKNNQDDSIEGISNNVPKLKYNISKEEQVYEFESISDMSQQLPWEERKGSRQQTQQGEKKSKQNLNLGSIIKEEEKMEQDIYQFSPKVPQKQQDIQFMMVQCVTLEGKFDILVSKQDTISNFRQKIDEQAGNIVKNQGLSNFQFIYKGTIFQEDKSLDYYNVQQFDAINLVEIEDDID